MRIKNKNSMREIEMTEIRIKKNGIRRNEKYKVIAKMFMSRS